MAGERLSELMADMHSMVHDQDIDDEGHYIDLEPASDPPGICLACWESQRTDPCMIDGFHDIRHTTREVFSFSGPIFITSGITPWNLI